MRRIIRRGVTALWAWILVGLLLPDGNGEKALHSFLKPGLWWLVAAGGSISGLFFLVSFAGDRHEHNHVKSRAGAVAKLLLLVVPVPFILSYGKAEYGTAALANRLALKSIQRAESTAIKGGPRKTNTDSVYRADLMALLYAPESFHGQRVKTTGMLYQGEEIPEDYAYCFRYVMVCCAADAMPVGVFIDKPDSLVVEKDAWYEVEGKIRTDSLDGIFVVKMDDAVMRPVQKPEQTWLYPR